MNSIEQFYIQSHYFHNQFISEQNAGMQNAMYQIIFDRQL